MNCHLAATLLDAYVDGELAATEHQRVQAHVQSCSPCAQKVTELSSLHTALTSGKLYHSPPGTLRGRVETALAAAPLSTSVLSQPISLSTAIIISVGFVLLAGGVWLSWPLLFSRKHLTIAEHTLKSYQRAVQSGNQISYSTSSAQLAHRWIKAQTRQEIEVRDLTRHGFVLQGARVEHFESNSIPVLVYAREGQSIDLYYWPMSCGTALRCFDIPATGCHLTGWLDASGVTCWAVSELPENRLKEFVGAASGKH